MDYLAERRAQILELHVSECGCGHDDCPRVAEYEAAARIGARTERETCIQEAEGQFPNRWPWSAEHPINNDQRGKRVDRPLGS